MAWLSVERGMQKHMVMHPQKKEKQDFHFHIRTRIADIESDDMVVFGAKDSKTLCEEGKQIISE